GPVELIDDTVSRVAESGGILAERFEHRLQFERRSAHDLEDVADRRLLGQRLGELAVLRRKLFEQPYVLDRDRRLVGEGFQELDLALRKGYRLAPAGEDNALH